MRKEDEGALRINPYIGSIPIVIPLKLFSDLLRGLLFPGGLSDSQSYGLNFTHVDRWAKAHATLCEVRESTDMLASRMYTFCARMRLQGSECKKKYSRIDCKVSNN